jgi:cytochrome P450
MTTEATSGQQPPPMFNPFDPAFRADPYPVYRRMHEEAPVMTGPMGLTLLSRYADCASLLRHPDASNDQRQMPDFADRIRAAGMDPDEEMTRTRPFLVLDPPDHTRLRGLVNKAFTPRMVESLRPRIQQLVDGLVDAARSRGEMDVIEDLAYPLPVQVICEMLGVPPEDNVKFRAWSAEVARSLDPEDVIPPDVRERREKTFEQFRAYFDELIAKKRAESGDDMLTALIQAEEQGDVLTTNELVATSLLLLIAGHETTVNLIGNGILALLRNPDQMELLRRDPSLIRTAVEELLRYDPPVQFTSRFVKRDVVLDGGAELKQWEQGIILLAAANRDRAQFADPDRLDITREDNRHLSFGMGIHFCLGAPLARVEGQIAIGAVVERLPNLRLATEQPEYKEQITLRGLASLPVVFGE